MPCGKCYGLYPNLCMSLTVCAIVKWDILLNDISSVLLLWTCRDRSTPDKKKKGAMFELSGMAAAAFAQLMPALVPLPIGRQPDGAAYEAYHLKHDEDIIE